MNKLSYKRHDITYEEWDAIKERLSGQEWKPGRTAKNNRSFMNGVFWIIRTGPCGPVERFGTWL